VRRDVERIFRYRHNARDRSPVSTGRWKATMAEARHRDEPRLRLGIFGGACSARQSASTWPQARSIPDRRACTMRRVGAGLSRRRGRPWNAARGDASRPPGTARCDWSPYAAGAISPIRWPLSPIARAAAGVTGPGRLRAEEGFAVVRADAGQILFGARRARTDGTRSVRGGVVRQASDAAPRVRGSAMRPRIRLPSPTTSAD
jgi:hypothetical protein